MSRKWRSCVSNLLICSQKFRPHSPWARLGRDVVALILAFVCADDWEMILEEGSLSQYSMWFTLQIRHYEPFQFFKIVFHRPEGLNEDERMTLGIVSLQSHGEREEAFLL
jgi:hypothetical protein